ncbi:carboxypeptidase-like regulatory domain-containing protein [Melittangium boletus]|uniref:Putative lipoprotein n=1 Tax=Melittangium boletus DSM 14713 TaxID=1294270 RepID=A0A250I831_9BACT|nr:carboxypeptidase-like regulatory domain-containing protein [Melittangium boletus]ATB27287.1 putative lipoprotein [Melittangium boletus DSM 14713]
MFRVPASWLVPLSLVLLSSCDGGLHVDRPTDVCTAVLVTLRVQVVNAQGMPVPDATVSATHLETGNTITSVTGDEGITHAVNEELGAGQVRLTARAGSKSSDTAEVAWSCDECHCSPDPESVQLRLNP